MARIAIALMGPTASGKTDLAISLTKQFNADIISVDAAQVYRGMNIGTAKPDAQVLREAPHRLIDIREPRQTYSAADFREDALREMTEIADAGRIPLLAGGTMFYFHVLGQGLPHLPAADDAVRARLTDQAGEIGWDAMHARLTAIDPVAGARIDRADRQRIQRALEVFELTGKSLTALSVDQTTSSDWTFIRLCITPSSRRVLHERIALRFEQMLDAGLVEEVENLLREGRLQPDSPAIRTVGYRQVAAWINGECSREQMARDGIAATRQLAKRQLTWLRRSRGIVWFDTLHRETGPAVGRYVRHALQSHGHDAQGR